MLPLEAESPGSVGKRFCRMGTRSGASPPVAALPSSACQGGTCGKYRTCAPWSITSGPGGNLWFTEEIGNVIGRITPSGSFSGFGIPTAKSRPEGITTGPDGNLWFTEENVSKIGRITTQ